MAKNAKLLIRAGYIHKEMAGVYSFLPLGLRVLSNIVAIIREEMNTLGAQELHLTALQDPEPWKKSGRWDDKVVDNWFKTKLRAGGEAGLGFTHEEVMMRIMQEYVQSYRDLPILAYQIQTKFRNEERAKSGIIRTREFLMKDLYSFAKSEQEHHALYEKVKGVYAVIFERLGIGKHTYPTFASGGSFSKYSHEFQTLCEAGEDTVYVNEEKRLAVNKEVLNNEVLADLGLKKEELVERTAVEVGNIFEQGTRFSEPLGLTFKDEAGKSVPVLTGAYGIGPARIMGVLVELCSDEKGIIWPQAVAPFKVHLISLGVGRSNSERSAEAFYKTLLQKGISVLLDDRDLRAGEKFADSDLIGIPTRVVMSEKTLEQGKVEVKDRKTGEVRMLTEAELLGSLN
ncbi:MAG: aminoacyl--tRNA ligase-related protein [bacterium]|nr:aminoacyl--tRNA ligase-related protein [bacterium]